MIGLPPVGYFTVDLYSNGTIAPCELAVSMEYPVLFNINGKPLATIACSGNNLEELALGHLLTEGLIQDKSDVSGLSFNAENLSLDIKTAQPGSTASEIPAIVTGGGRARKDRPHEKLVRTELPRITPETVISAMKRFLESSQLHSLTHGVHSAGLMTLQGESLILIDDIGRHNAIDKVIGHALKSGIDLSRCMLLSTGRISSEIAHKIVRSGIPVFISRAAPTSYALDIIREFNVLVLCRVRDSEFIILNGSENIIL